MSQSDESYSSSSTEDLSDSDDDRVFDPENFPGQCFGEQFRVQELWDTKEALVEWVKTMGGELKMTLVIRRSNARVVQIVCENFGKYRDGKAKGTFFRRTDKDCSKKSGCKFELRGYLERKNAQLSHRRWMLIVINASHNHRRPESWVGHAFAGRMNAEEKSLVRNLTNTYTKPNVIVEQLKKAFPHNVTSSKQVLNYIQALGFENRGDKSVMQWTLSFLRDNEYEVRLSRTEKNEVGILFFAHPESLKLFKRFPYVVIVDATYKMNRYGMPLVEIVGLTCNYKSFNVAYAFSRNETFASYCFIMRSLKSLCNQLGVMPSSIVTDREKALIMAIDDIFQGEVKHLLCWVHIRHNIEAYALPILKDKMRSDAFANQCWGLFCSSSAESYKLRLEALRKAWGVGLTRYLEKQWLGPYKESIVRAWTDHHIHFQTRTTNRVEGMHGVLKRIVDSSIGGFNRVIVRIHHAVGSQITKVQASLEFSVRKKPTHFNKMSKPRRAIFQRLFYKVSTKCLDLLYEMFKDILEDKIDDCCDDFWMRECMGLPCIHELATHCVNNEPLKPKDVHIFWRQLEWDRVVGGDGEVPHGNGPTLLCRSLWKEMLQKMELGQLRDSTVEQITYLYQDLEHPEQSTLLEPSEVVPHKGGATGSNKWSNTRNPSGFEHQKNEQEKRDKEKENEAQKKAKSKSQGWGRAQPPKGRGQQISSVVAVEEIDTTDSQPFYHTGEGSAPEPLHEPTFLFGINFGVDNIDSFWYRFIVDARNVMSDGHCGYRSLAVLSGYDEGFYQNVRVQLASHMLSFRALYEPLCHHLYSELTFEEIVRRVGYTRSPCAKPYWLSMPLMGLAFASMARCAVAFLSWYGPCLCLPLVASGHLDAPPTRIITIAHVGARDHLIPVVLRDDSPLPPTPHAWMDYRDPSVIGWELAFAGRVELFRDHRHACGRSKFTLV